MPRRLLALAAGLSTLAAVVAGAGDGDGIGRLWRLPPGDATAGPNK